ncbi:zinc ribbon domain-containing protein [Methanobrevibacter olleyae]|uniref:DZANK-type domain-containing protein n=1 Tax=Methanobrevibacter olleyae TaxID=294671 RepID=A0A126R012_METOL|nr:zinc ribbon domain-containing protein [Methanobrevibacter olleyae]AMK15289.1 hypothetical protein YLM1_0732 [Methanobrevibacter olleyae]
MEVNEKVLKNLILCIFLGIVSFVIIFYATYEMWVSIIISSLIIGFLSNGLGVFDNFDEVLTAAIYAFVATFIAFYVFIPLASLVAAAILMWACVAAIIAAIICFIKLYYLKKGNEDNSNTTTNVNKKLTDNPNEFKDCPDCGAKVKKEAKFCEKCGTKIEEVATEDVFCDSCGAKIESDAEFCDSCGAKID